MIFQDFAKIFTLGTPEKIETLVNNNNNNNNNNNV